MQSRKTHHIQPHQLIALDRLLDRQQISDCLVRFSRGVDCLDRELFLSAFHPDASISSGHFSGGPPGFYEQVVARCEDGAPTVRHRLLSQCCEIDGDTARSEASYLFAGSDRDGTCRLVRGRYIGRLECRDDDWKIARCRVAIEWSETVPSIPTFFADLADAEIDGPALNAWSDITCLRTQARRCERN